jgi:alpha-tubulin suppressor-like RCC1 family protein
MTAMTTIPRPALGGQPELLDTKGSKGSEGSKFVSGWRDWFARAISPAPGNQNKLRRITPRGPVERRSAAPAGPPVGLQLRALRSLRALRVKLFRMERAFAAAVVLVAACGDSGVEPDQAAPPEAFIYSDVSAGGEHTCGLAPTGAVYCWGRGDRGVLGDSVLSASDGPVRVKLSRGALGVSAGYGHACAVTLDQEVHCWGWNIRGQLGIGDRADQATPVPVAGDRRYVAVSAGGAHSCALDLGGQAFCWGENGQGQLGDGSASDALVPVRVATDERFSAISAGAQHTCAITVGGEGRCWGLNHRGQLGTGSLVTTTRPAPVAGGVTFRSISAGYSHSCGVADNRRVYCWGDNERGQLGNGSVSQPGQPGSVQPVPIVRPAAGDHVSAGHHYSCAVSTLGDGFCWGRGEDYQLGLGLRFDHSVPQQIMDRDIRFAAISAGGLRHTCAVSRHGGAYCWGMGDMGQLGVPAVSVSSVPIRVSGGLSR